MSDNVYAEDSVREYNGAGVLIIIGAIGIVFFTVLFLVFEHFYKDLPLINFIITRVSLIFGYGYCIYTIVHHFLERHATFNFTYNNGHLEIAKVRKNGQKKLLFSAECESLEVMGSYLYKSKKYIGSELYKKTVANNYTEMSFCGEPLDGNERNWWEARFNIMGKYVLIHFNPSDEFVKTMKSQFPDKVIFYDSQEITEAV